MKDTQNIYNAKKMNWKDTVIQKINNRKHKTKISGRVSQQKKQILYASTFRKYTPFHQTLMKQILKLSCPEHDQDDECDQDEGDAIRFCIVYCTNQELTITKHNYIRLTSLGVLVDTEKINRNKKNIPTIYIELTKDGVVVLKTLFDITMWAQDTFERNLQLETYKEGMLSYVVGNYIVLKLHEIVNIIVEFGYYKMKECEENHTVQRINGKSKLKFIPAAAGVYGNPRKTDGHNTLRNLIVLNGYYLNDKKSGSQCLSDCLDDIIVGVQLNPQLQTGKWCVNIKGSKSMESCNVNQYLEQMLPKPSMEVERRWGEDIDTFTSCTDSNLGLGDDGMETACHICNCLNDHNIKCPFF